MVLHRSSSFLNEGMVRLRRKVILKVVVRLKRVVRLKGFVGNCKIGVFAKNY